MGFSEELVKLRWEKGLSQAKLAKELGVSQSSINYWEKGQRAPSAEAVQKIAAYFNVSMSELMGVGHIAQRGLEILEDARGKWSSQAPNTLAAHFEGEEFTPEEIEEIKQFAEFVKSKRNK